MPPANPFSRYYGLDLVELDGAVGLAQRAIQRALDPTGSLIHVCVGGETLDQLARQYYGREDLWWRIADANDARFPLDWGPGDTLVIPPIHTAARSPRRSR
jgi:nucleoid-associated protein YgaU